MTNEIIIFGANPTNPKELAKWSFAMTRFVMGRSVMQIQVCICWFLKQCCIEHSVTIYLDSSV